MVRSASSGEKVAARLSPPDSTMTIFRARELLLQLGDGGQVDAGVLADGAVRTAARLDADDPVQRQRLAPRQELGVLPRVDVVGDDGEVELGPEGPAQAFDEGRLAGADRPADAEREDAPLRAGKVSVPAARRAVVAVTAGPRRVRRRAAMRRAQDRNSAGIKSALGMTRTS